MSSDCVLDLHNNVNRETIFINKLHRLTAGTLCILLCILPYKEAAFDRCILILTNLNVVKRGMFTNPLKVALQCFVKQEL